MSNKPIIVSFDGNIGSGKSTIMNYFKTHFENYCIKNKKYFKICFLDEPVSEWESIIDIYDGKNIIEKFYENNQAYAFTFQIMAYISRLSSFKNVLLQDYDIIFTERSMYTDRHVFAKMLYDTGKINSIEFQVYNKWFDEFLDCIKNIKTVYVRTSPEICKKRVSIRARTGENIPLSYLQTCHEYHESWLNQPTKIEEGNTLFINGNQETSNDIEDKFYNTILYNVYNFIL